MTRPAEDPDVPSLFLDTNIILDVLWAKETGDDSAELVEVHLSNGIELGPTTPVDLAPGQVHEIDLAASSNPFESWSTHPEVG